MEQFALEIIEDSDILSFDVVDYAHHEEENRCKFEVLHKGKFIASFEPDSRGFLHICKNTGDVDEEILHLIADKLEIMNF